MKSLPATAGALLAIGAIVLAAGCGEEASRDSPASTHAETGAWSPLPELPNQRDRPPDVLRPPNAGYQELEAVRVGGKVVIVAGVTYAQSRLETVAYDLGSRRWRLTTSPMWWRYGYSAVATGEEVIVWGGCCGPGGKGSRAEGMRYDPIENEWRAMADSPLSRRGGHSAAWTGEEMIVWGGLRGRSDGAAYDPERDTWREISEAPLERRSGHAAVWTGEEMIVWGGVPAGAPSENQLVLADGAAYDPNEDAWRRIPKAPIRSREGSEGAQAVWTGAEMLVWNSGEGAAYDPEVDAWRRLPDARRDLTVNDTVVWTGEAMIAWGGGGHRGRADGIAYHPASDEWARVPEAPLSGRDRHTAVWTGNGMLVWGGCCAGRYYADGAVFTPR